MLFGSVETVGITGGAAANSIDAPSFTGTAILDGATGDDILQGGSGNDSLFFGTGNDSVYGNAGNDMMYGQDGNDVLSGDDLIAIDLTFTLLGSIDGGDGIDTCTSPAAWIKVSC